MKGTNARGVLSQADAVAVLKRQRDDFNDPVIITRLSQP